MAITQQWYNYAFDECRAADAAAASGAAGGSLGLARRRTVFIELATACLLQTQELFFRAQAPILLEGLRSLLWAPATVEPALHCVLRLLRGAYHEPLPFWSATGMGKTDGLSRGGENPNHRDEVALLPFGSPMYHREDTRSALLRLAHLQVTGCRGHNHRLLLLLLHHRLHHHLHLTCSASPTSRRSSSPAGRICRRGMRSCARCATRSPRSRTPSSAPRRSPTPRC